MVPYDPAPKVVAKLPGRRGRFLSSDPALGVAVNRVLLGRRGAFGAVRPSPKGGSPLDARNSGAMFDKFSGCSHAANPLMRPARSPHTPQPPPRGLKQA